MKHCDQIVTIVVDIKWMICNVEEKLVLMVGIKV